jgi:hypothetical protein
MLLSRNYNKNVVKNAMLCVVFGQNNPSPKGHQKHKQMDLLALTYNPKLPSVPHIIKKTLENINKRPKNAKNLPNPTHGRLQTTTKPKKCAMQSEIASKHPPQEEAG